MIPWVRRAGTALLQSPTVNGAVRAMARARGHRLVLVYHRLGSFVRAGREIVPTVPVDVFRAQLQALGEVADLVSIDELLAAGHSMGRGAADWRPAVAVTFDDDLPSHADQALPLLVEFGVPAAFFLSGRALHGRGAYWFQQLEALLVAHGEPRTAALLGLPEAQPAGLVLACQNNAAVRRHVSELSAGLPTSDILAPNAIRALVAAGMTLGFHTIEHDVASDLDDADLDLAVSRGREDLAAASGAAVRYFAYPHGKADDRSAAAVRSAGFDAAFTGRPEPVRQRDDRFRLGRWEPGPLGVDDLLVKLAVRLHRAAPPPRKGLP